MNAATPFPDNLLPPGAQPAPASARSHAPSLHDQLYRYAEDLQQLIERNGTLESHCESLRASSARLLESRKVLDDLMHNSRDIHIVTDRQGTVLQSNPAIAALAPLQRVVGSPLQDWVLPAHRGDFLALHMALVEGREVPSGELEMHLRREEQDAPPLIVSTQALAVGDQGTARCVHWILRDVTHLRETEFDSQISSMVFNSTAEGVLITDVDGAILAVNPAFSAITGYSSAEAIGRNPRFLNSGLQDEAFYADFWRALREHGNWQGEIYNRKKSGEVYPEWLTISAARDPEGRVLTYIAVFTDLSRLLKEEKRLAYLAHHDSLTNLPNRLLFEDRLEQTLSQARRFDQSFTLIFIDLDRFKAINDEHGHQTGDRVLQEAAQRLSAAVREVDTVARLGGDEFVILAPGLTGAADIGSFCAKVIDKLVQPIAIDAITVSIGGSLGCAEYPCHGEDPATLLKRADQAMYQAKAVGGNTHILFSPAAGTGHPTKESS